MLNDVIAVMIERHQEKMLTGIVSDIPEEKMTAQPIAGMNHPAWLLGHLLGLEQKIATGVIGKTVRHPLPSDWWEVYGIGSVPRAEPALYKSKAFCMEALGETSKIIADYFRELKDADLEKPIPDASLAKHFSNLASLLVVIPTHRAYHTGQIASWRKAMGMPHVGM